jgi:hypothetical protein
MEKIALSIDPSGHVEQFFFDDKNCLTLFQERVGGYIQPVDLPIQGWNMVVNEEGKIHELPYNEYGTLLWELNYGVLTDAIMGTVVLTSIEVGDDGETIGLTHLDIIAINRLISEYKSIWEG